jgi:hypothetical protein
MKEEVMLIIYSFGVTELAKGSGDEEVARAATHDEKPHNTHVQETTTDVISPQNQELNKTPQNQGMI